MRFYCAFEKLNDEMHIERLVGFFLLSLLPENGHAGEVKDISGIDIEGERKITGLSSCACVCERGNFRYNFIMRNN
jgi:hypothetical protein